MKKAEKARKRRRELWSALNLLSLHLFSLRIFLFLEGYMSVGMFGKNVNMRIRGYERSDEVSHFGSTQR